MRLEVLGPVELHGPGGPVPLPGHKLRQLVTVLALAAPEHVARDRLVDALWADPPPSATKTLQAHLSRLRGAVAAAGAPDALSTHPTGYRLEVDGTSDLDEVRSLRRRAEAAQRAGDATGAVVLLGEACARWRGEPELPDTPVGDVLRRRLRDEQLNLLDAHLAALIDTGAAAEAVQRLGELVSEEPLNERLWELRILALYRSGRPTEALRAHGEVRAMLAEQVGVEPGPALQALEGAILRHEVVPTPPPVPSGSEPTAPDIAYARSPGGHIAHRSFGTGDADVLLLNPGLISIDTFLDEPHLARGIERLADGRRVVALDPRGVGLSDRTQPPGTITIDDWVDDVVAVLDATGAARPHVFASHHGALLALALAARSPERVRSLTLMNAFARFTWADDYPHGYDAAGFAAVQASFQSPDAPPGVDALTLISPSVAGDPDYRAWWDAAGRRAAGPAAAAALVSMMSTVDLRPIVPAVVAPTLLVIRRGCPMYDPGHGEWLADRLPHATVAQHHDVNDPWWVGDANFILAAFERFIADL